MKLQEIEIENFGNFTKKVKIKLGGAFSTIIGENGSGKSTVIFLINLLLDKKKRKQGITTEWIPNKEKEIKVKYIFDASNFSKINVALPIEEENKITIMLNLEWDEVANYYFPTIFIGNIENLKYSYLQKLPFDDYIQVINIDHFYENNHENWIEKEYEETEVLKDVEDNISKANNEIAKIFKIKKFDQFANKKIKETFKNDEFKVRLTSNVKTTKMGKALNFFPEKQGNIIETHGSGFERVFSIISNIQTYDKSNQIKIILIDELENNLFYIYQGKIVNYLNNLIRNNFCQIIVTTHSPNIVKITPKTSITKLRKNLSISHFIPSFENKHFDFYQKELSIAIFYENILLVEGHSEKLFYEYIFKNNELIKDYIDTSPIFVLNNQGVDFNQTLNLLRSLSSNVYLLTDNDVWKNNKEIEEYMGLKRICKLINDIDTNCNYDSYDFTKANANNTPNTLENIRLKAEEYNIFTQEKTGDSFEESLLNEELVTEEQKSTLKRSKLKSLLKFIPEISSRITKETINNSPYLFKWMKSLKNGK